jgi:hypothetical protein
VCVFKGSRVQDFVFQPVGGEKGFHGGHMLDLTLGNIFKNGDFPKVSHVGVYVPCEFHLLEQEVE